jgi:hypothetical protein
MADDRQTITAAEAAKAAASAAASVMAKIRMEKLGAKGRRELAGRAGTAQWAGYSAKERSLEMRRRVAKGKRRKATEALQRAKAEKATRQRRG